MTKLWGVLFMILFFILALFNSGNTQGIAPRQHLNADSIGYIPYSYTATGVFKYIPLKGFLTDSVSIGAEAINDLTDGKSNETNNLFLGTNAGVSASSTRSTGVGLNSLAVSTGADNNGFGYNAGTLIGVGAYNNAFGTYALDNLTIGDFNSGFGQSSLSDVVSGSYNSGFGAYSLINFEGSGGTAIGYRALYNLTTGNNNTAAGYQAGYGNGAYSSSIGNTWIGANAGYGISSGAIYNTGVGFESGKNIFTGDYNTNIGTASGGNISTGSYNTTIGYDADVLIGTDSYQLNVHNTIIGGAAGFHIMPDVTLS